MFDNICHGNIFVNIHVIVTILTIRVDMCKAYICKVAICIIILNCHFEKWQFSTF